MTDFIDDLMESLLELFEEYKFILDVKREEATIEEIKADKTKEKVEPKIIALEITDEEQRDVVKAIESIWVYGKDDDREVLVFLLGLDESYAKAELDHINFEFIRIELDKKENFFKLLKYAIDRIIHYRYLEYIWVESFKRDMDELILARLGGSSFIGKPIKINEKSIRVEPVGVSKEKYTNEYYTVPRQTFPPATSWDSNNTMYPLTKEEIAEFKGGKTAIDIFRDRIKIKKLTNMIEMNRAYKREKQEEIRTLARKYEKYLPERIKIEKEWIEFVKENERRIDLSTIEDGKRVATVLLLLFKKIEHLFENQEELSYGIEKDELIFLYSYKDTDYNKELVKLIDEIIENIKAHKINIQNLNQTIDSLKFKADNIRGNKAPIEVKIESERESVKSDDRQLTQEEKDSLILMNIEELKKPEYKVGLSNTVIDELKKRKYLSVYDLYKSLLEKEPSYNHPLTKIKGIGYGKIEGLKYKIEVQVLGWYKETKIKAISSKRTNAKVKFKADINKIFRGDDPSSTIHKNYEIWLNEFEKGKWHLWFGSGNNYTKHTRGNMFIKADTLEELAEKVNGYDVYSGSYPLLYTDLIIIKEMEIKKDGEWVWAYKYGNKGIIDAINENVLESLKTEKVEIREKTKVIYQTEEEKASGDWVGFGLHNLKIIKGVGDSLVKSLINAGYQDVQEVYNDSKYNSTKMAREVDGLGKKMAEDLWKLIGDQLMTNKQMIVVKVEAGGEDQIAELIRNEINGLKLELIPYVNVKISSNDAVKKMWDYKGNFDHRSLLNFLDVKFDDRDSRGNWENVSPAIKKIMIDNYDKIIPIFSGLKLNIGVSEKGVIDFWSIEEYWKNLKDNQREFILFKMSDYAKKTAKEHSKKEWSELSGVTKGRIITGLKIIFEVFFAILYIDVDVDLLSQLADLRIKDKKDKEQPLEEEARKEKDIENYIVQKQKVLEENILSILCKEIPPSKYQNMSNSKLWGMLFGLGYTGADTLYIGNALSKLKKDKIIKEEWASSSYSSWKTIKLEDNIICNDNYQIQKVGEKIPKLENFPLVKEEEILKRVILHLMCENAFTRGDNYGMPTKSSTKTITLKNGQRKKIQQTGLFTHWQNYFKYRYGVKDFIKNLIVEKHKTQLYVTIDSIFDEEIKELKDRKLIVVQNAPPDYIESVKFKINVDFLWKTYKLGVFQEIDKITECSLYIDKDNYNSLTQIKKLNIQLLLQKYPRFHLLGYLMKDGEFVALIYNYEEFQLVKRTDLEIQDISLDYFQYAWSYYSLGITEKLEKNKNRILGFLRTSSSFEEKQYDMWICPLSKGIKTLQDILIFKKSTSKASKTNFIPSYPF